MLLQPNNYTLYYIEALQELSRTVGDLCQHALYSCEDWLYWAEEHHPSAYKELVRSIEQANNLWGLKNELSLDMFKRAVAIEVQITKYIIPLYLTWQSKQEVKINTVTTPPKQEQQELSL